MSLSNVLLVCVLVVQAQSDSAKSVPDLAISVRGRAIVPGEVLTVDVLAPADVTEVTVSALGQETTAWSLGDGRWRALIGIDLEVKPGPQVVSVTARARGRDPLAGQTSVNVESKEFPTRTLTVDPKFVTPPPSARPRIEREASGTRPPVQHSDANWRVARCLCAANRGSTGIWVWCTQRVQRPVACTPWGCRLRQCGRDASGRTECRDRRARR